MSTTDLAVPHTPPQLPQRFARHATREAERVFYVARPGLGALPSGAGVMFGFAMLQAFTLLVLLWAIWWPTPSNPRMLAFAIGGTAMIVGAGIFVAALLLRRHPGFLLAVARAPFIRLTVTDRRVLWSLPWTPHPLMEIMRGRIVGGILGIVDRKGRGNAAMVLIPGDPSADIDGNIHFDRLPDAAGFVAALARI